MRPEPSLLLAQLLDLHLTRTIARLKSDEAPMTSKFRELAEGIKGDIANFDHQADELMKRREDLRRRGETVFAKHREHQDDVASGLEALERAIAEMEGSNSKNGEGSGDSSGKSFQDGERG